MGVQGMDPEREAALDKFNKALEAFDIDYNSETGRLSEPIILLAFDSKRKFTVERILILKDFFLLIWEKDSKIKRISHDQVKGFRSVTKTIE
jgi:hypothetical protein